MCQSHRGVEDMRYVGCWLCDGAKKLGGYSTSICMSDFFRRGEETSNGADGDGYCPRGLSAIEWWWKYEYSA